MHTHTRFPNYDTAKMDYPQACAIWLFLNEDILYFRRRVCNEPQTLYHSASVLMSWLYHAASDLTSWLCHAASVLTSWLCHAASDLTSWLYHAVSDLTSWLYYSASNLTLWPLTTRLCCCRYRKKDVAKDWESILQTRLSQEVKDKELKQVSNTVSQETLTSSSKNSVRQSKAMKAMPIELNTSDNIDMTTPSGAPAATSSRRVITQPPFLSDEPVGRVSTSRLAQAAAEDDELAATRSSGDGSVASVATLTSGDGSVASVATLTQQHGSSSDSLVRPAGATASQPHAVTSSVFRQTTAQGVESASITNMKRDKPQQVRNAIALFENMKPPPSSSSQPDAAGRRTTLVLIQRDERGHPESRGAGAADTDSAESKLKVEVLKLEGSSVSDADSQRRNSPASNPAGSLEANLYSAVRRVDKPPSTDDTRRDDNRRQDDDDDDADDEVRIVEIARL